MNGAASTPHQSLRVELFRIAVIMAVSTALALINNYTSKHPVPLLAADGPGALPEMAERITTDVMREEMKTQILLLVDVRGSEAFSNSHAYGSLNAPATDFMQHYQRLNLASKIAAVDGVVLICKDDQCPASDRVAKMLSSMNVKNVRVLHGGWDAYKKSGLPLEGTP